MTLGRYVIPDVSVWAFEAPVGETSPVIEARPAYYVFRLDSVIPEGTPPLAQIRDDVLDAARVEKRRQAAQRQAEQIAQDLHGPSNLLEAGAARGLAVRKVGPFTRLTPPAILQSNPLVVGAAFGLRRGMRSGVIKDRSGFFLVEGLSRTPADSAAWLKQKDAQRESVLQPARQARIQAFLAAVRAQAKIVDRRKQIFTARAASGS
jgi:hypothetical protein